MIVAVGGSWCPNCHDEAPFLVSLYKKYRAQGLEIVNLDFEQGDPETDTARLKAFIAHYGITYPVLVGGSTDEVGDKIPQAVKSQLLADYFLPESRWPGEGDTRRVCRAG